MNCKIVFQVSDKPEIAAQTNVFYSMEQSRTTSFTAFQTGYIRLRNFIKYKLDNA